MRVFISGVGGELGTRVASLLEEQPWVTAVGGIDREPPRGRLRRTEFTMADPRDRSRTVAAVEAFGPEILVHLGVYEPNARANPKRAALLTEASAVNLLGAAARSGRLTGIVVRSGIEVYGRRRGAPLRPDESALPHPTSAFGRSLLRVEEIARDAGRDAFCPVTALRFAPIVGPHFPSPLGRYLRLPAVPVGMTVDAPFSLLHQEDAARATVAAVSRRYDGPLNVVGPEAATPFQAVRIGNRIPVFVSGLGWYAAKALAAAAGAPLPEHAIELLSRGRTADGSRAVAELGIAPTFSTPEVVRALYEWATVAYFPAQRPAAEEVA